MIELRHSEERGVAEHGWLSSRHSFSFARYYDPAHMGVSCLRVINDDKVSPGAGFSTHSHADMEIISYVKRGTIEHKDSMGHVEQIPAGDFQLMTAGTGVTHSEYNPSQDEALEFLQIWIEPNVYGIDPGYQQKRFEFQSGLQLIASPDGREGSLLIHQDAYLYRLKLETGQSARHPLASGRKVYLHMVNGELELEGQHLVAGDGATITSSEQISLHAEQDCEALLFDLP